MVNAAVILDRAGMERALRRMAHEIDERNRHDTELVLVGVQRGGVILARRLTQLLAALRPRSLVEGSLDVSMHRDDLDGKLAPTVHPTTIPCDITDKVVVLADDVLFSGRTVRAAMDALNDLGRPKAIQLAVLVDRGHRELPIRADFVGKNVSTTLDQTVEVRFEEEAGEDAVLLHRA
jgi:pyrimidine operon attenuation protein/uracil phosphoribosyltransferase